MLYILQYAAFFSKALTILSGVSALAGTIVLGPRTGRFVNPEDSVSPCSPLHLYEASDIQEPSSEPLARSLVERVGSSERGRGARERERENPCTIALAKERKREREREGGDSEPTQYFVAIDRNTPKPTTK